MKKSFVGVCQSIRVEEVVISDVTKKLYDYSNREADIQALVESISEIGLQQPISVVPFGDKYFITDGVLRYKACVRLNLNEVDAIVSGFVVTDEFSLVDLIIHHQIHKVKTQVEKLNEVKGLLRIESEDKNPLRDKDKRVKLVSSLLGGKGWGRNNVFSFEKILRWEKSTNSGQRLAERVMSNEIAISKALETIVLIENPWFVKEKEAESHIVEGFVKGKYPAGKAVKLMDVYDKKKAEGHTVINLFPIDGRSYSILQGNIEDIELPDDLLIDTIFTSPPYYKLRKYGDDPNELGWESTPDLYVKRLADILMKGFAKLKETGSMFVNLGESYENCACLAVTERITIELIKRGANFVDRLIWNKLSNKPVPNQVKRLRPGYETILHFSKTSKYYFERVRIKSEKTLQVARGCAEKGSDEVTYHIPNNYDQFRNVLVDDEVSNFLTVQINKNRTKHIEGEEVHPATFSSNLPVIPLLFSTPKSRDSVVFDPFMGSGSCGVTSLLLGFKFVGVELYEKSIVTAQRILNESQEAFDQECLDLLLEEYRDYEVTEEIQECA